MDEPQHRPPGQSTGNASVQPLGVDQIGRLVEVLEKMNTTLDDILQGQQTTSEDTGSTGVGFGTFNYEVINKEMDTCKPLPYPPIRQSVTKGDGETDGKTHDGWFLRTLRAIHWTYIDDWSCLLDTTGLDPDQDSEPDTWLRSTAVEPWEGVIRFHFSDQYTLKACLWDATYSNDGLLNWNKRYENWGQDTFEVLTA